VTKSDLGDPEIAMLEASELLPGAEVVAVSARTGDGLEDLRAALDRAAGSVDSRADASGLARLHVDRAFTIRGAGTVVTGTLWSGQVARGDEVVLLPGDRRARVRGVQVHDQPLEEAAAGQRVALNLTGVSVDEVRRGDVIATGASDLRPGYLLDARLEFSGREPEHGDRVQIHHGTREAPARLAWLGGRFWQIRLEQELVAAPGDRLVVRDISPADTIGGGVVLDAHPRKHGPSRDLLVRLERLARGEPAAEERPKAAAAKPAPTEAAPAPLSPSALALERRLLEAGFEPPLDSELDAGDLEALRAAGRAVRVSKALHYHPDVLADIRRRVIALAADHGGAVTLAQLRDELGTSRKFAQALLEHLDATKVTIRRGDEHVVRRSAIVGG
jgi:selenocysteine-specific elongation factor